MSEFRHIIFEKEIHRDELKLRLLMTDGCNLSCGFCLNDFQSKPEKNMNFMSLKTGEISIRRYEKEISSDYPPQVYFSGGEPTLNKNLPDLLRIAKSLNCRVTLNTNGYFKKELEHYIRKYCDQVHFGTYKKSKYIAEKAKRLKGSIQCIYSQSVPYVNYSFLNYYINNGLHVKVFQDFNDNSEEYKRFASKMINLFDKKALSFRFTGIQENRGSGCDGCSKKCITLKAAWVFPDNGTSPCPQLYRYSKEYPKSRKEWSLYFKKVKSFHNFDERGSMNE